MPTPPVEDLLAAGWPISVDRDKRDAETDLLHMLEIQRRRPASDGKYYIGGYAVLTTVTADDLIARLKVKLFGHSLLLCGDRDIHFRGPAFWNGSENQYQRLTRFSECDPNLRCCVVRRHLNDRKRTANDSAIRSMRQLAPWFLIRGDSISLCRSSYLHILQRGWRLQTGRGQPFIEVRGSIGLAGSSEVELPLGAGPATGLRAPGFSSSRLRS